MIMKNKTFTVASWNVRTLLDLKDNINRPERRTALITHELARLKIDVAALSETRLSGEGNINETCTGYTVFWKGKEDGEHRIHGVGFAVRTSLVKEHHLAPIAINERLMTLRIPLFRDRYLTLISSYAPTLNDDEDSKNRFYHQLNTVLTKVPATDKLLLLGDFNARVGRDNRLWENVMGSQGVGNCNANGLLLLGLCAEHELFITNTQFRLPNRYKTTWMHPRSKHWHLIDYVITRQRDKKDVLITKTARNIDDCWTDHKLLLSQIRISIYKKPRTHFTNHSRRKFNISKLHNEDIAAEFQKTILDKLTQNPVNSHDTDIEWTTLQNIILETAEKSVGFKDKKSVDWFDDNNEKILSLISSKRTAYLSLTQDPSSVIKKIRFQELKKKCQTEIREIKNDWWQQKSRELQGLSDARDLRNFYAGLKEIYGPSRSSTGILKAADNTTVLTNSQDILMRWKEHFSTLLNRSSTAADDFLRHVPQHPPQPWMAVPPTFHEFNKAIRSLKPRKAPGPDNIPLELILGGGLPLKTRLFSLILLIWETQSVPANLKNATIVTIFKKGDRSICGNYRGISLLSTVGKIFARILLNRLQTVSEKIFPESQCGFRTSRSTIDMIFCARQLQEKCREQQKPLLFVFYDLEKAFDTVPRQAMWMVLSRFGCPEPFVGLVKAVHDGMVGQVLYQNDISGDFPITNGLKQGCVLAPTLFSLYLTAMLYEITSANIPGVEIRYRSDGGLFNQARLRSKRLTNITKITELQYADDNASPAHTPMELQLSVNLFKNAYERFGLTINTQKTKVLAQPVPGTSFQDFNITISDISLEQVDHFSYLGSILSARCTSEKDVENRIRAAHIAFGRLSHRVFRNKDLTLCTKLMVYQAVVISTLLYGCETWTMYRRDIKKLERFHQHKLRTIMNIRWEDYITNVSVLEKAQLCSIEAFIIRHRLRWTGHIQRMNNSRLPRQILYSELSTGKRPRGAPLKRYKDQLKKTMLCTSINPNTWHTLAEDRSSWRKGISSGVKHFEEERRRHEKEARERRKLRQAQPHPPPSIRCNVCGRMFHARIGLQSHQRHRHGT